MPQNNSKIKQLVIDNNILIPEVIRLINSGHSVTLPLKGYSMRPFLESERDNALLVRVSNPKVGDPVLAEVAQGRYVLHRIISIDGDDVVLRGDGNMGTERCRLSDIKASVKGFYRKGRSKLDSTNGMKWKTYSWLWMRLYPVRRWLLAFHRHVWLRIKR